MLQAYKCFCWDIQTFSIVGKRKQLHFFKRIIQLHYTFSNEYNPFLYTFSSESSVYLQKFSGSITVFLCKSTSLEEKVHANHRNPKKTTTFVFNKRSVTHLRKCPITQHLVSDSGHSTKRLKRGGTTRICKAMKYSGLHLSLHSVHLSKLWLYRLK